MYAVIATGGKQYRVQEGDVIKVEKLDVDAGADVEFENILLVADGDNVKVGNPYLEGSKVLGNVKAHGRHKKIEIIKFKRRKHYRRQMGHRQHYTEVRITSIAG